MDTQCAQYRALSDITSTYKLDNLTQLLKTGDMYMYMSNVSEGYTTTTRTLYIILASLFLPKLMVF